MPVVVKFVQLQTLSISFYSENSQQPRITRENEDQHEMSRLTGVRWLTSLTNHPLDRELQEVRLSRLINWSVALLAVCSCKLLVIKSMSSQDLIHVQDLRERLANGDGLSRTTYLEVVSLSSAEVFEQFIVLVKSLLKLEVGIAHGTYLSRLPRTKELGKDAQLRSLWLEHISSITPAGLQITIYILP